MGSRGGGRKKRQRFRRAVLSWELRGQSLERKGPRVSRERSCAAAAQLHNATQPLDPVALSFARLLRSVRAPTDGTRCAADVRSTSNRCGPEALLCACKRYFVREQQPWTSGHSPGRPTLHIHHSLSHRFRLLHSLSTLVLGLPPRSRSLHLLFLLARFRPPGTLSLSRALFSQSGCGSTGARSGWGALPAGGVNEGTGEAREGAQEGRKAAEGRATVGGWRRGARVRVRQSACEGSSLKRGV